MNAQTENLINHLIESQGVELCRDIQAIQDEETERALSRTITRAKTLITLPDGIDETQIDLNRVVKEFLADD